MFKYNFSYFKTQNMSELLVTSEKNVKEVRKKFVILRHNIEKLDGQIFLIGRFFGQVTCNLDIIFVF